jgi:hypothetical protein
MRIHIFNATEYSPNEISVEGGQLTGPLYLSADPEDLLDAVNKKYADTQFQTVDNQLGAIVNGEVDVALYGPSTIQRGETVEYKIMNYDAFSSYTVSVDTGTVTLNEDTITINAPSTGTELKLTVTRNGELRETTIPLVESTGKVLTPHILYPSNGQTDVEIKPILTSSPFSYTGPSQSHIASQWQVSTDPGFTNIIEDTGQDTVNLTQFTATSIASYTQTYYVRVRYYSDLGNVSNWSPVVSFTTVSNFTPDEIKITAIKSTYKTSAWNSDFLNENGTDYIYVTGYVYDYPGTGNYIPFVAKTDINGNVIWGELLKDDFNSANDYTGLALNIEGGVPYVYGVSTNIVYKLNGLDGSVVWSKKVDQNYYRDFNLIYVVKDSVNPEIYLFFNPTVDNDRVQAEKWDKDGNVLLSKELSTSSSDRFMFRKIESQIENGTRYFYIHLTLDSVSNSQWQTVGLIKLDTDFNVVFLKNYTVTDPSQVAICNDIDVTIIDNKPIVYMGFSGNTLADETLSCKSYLKLDGDDGTIIKALKHPLNEDYDAETDYTADIKVIESSTGKYVYMLFENSSSSLEANEVVVYDTDLNYVTGFRIETLSDGYLYPLNLLSHDEVDPVLHVVSEAMLFTPPSATASTIVFSFKHPTEVMTGQVTVNDMIFQFSPYERNLLPSDLTISITDFPVTVTNITPNYIDVNLTKENVAFTPTTLTYT